MGRSNANQNTPSKKPGGKATSAPSTKPGGKRASTPGTKPGGKRASTPRSAKKNQAAGKRKAQGGKKLFRRAKSGTVALREIRKLQQTTRPLLQKAPFQRIVREKTAAHLKNTVKGSGGEPPVPRFQMRALYALQEATEAYMTRLFEHAVLLQLYRKRKTLRAKDLEYVRRIRDEL